MMIVIVAIIMTARIMNSVEEIKEYAKENRVPIIKEAGLSFLLEQIKKYEVKTVLEIGSAIGYSAIMMSSLANVTTIERDKNMYELALKNIKDLNLEAKIKIILADALDSFALVKDKTFDLLFIDAAKAQYEKFFNLYTPLLKKGGLVICDNLLFHGLVKESDLSGYSRNLRSLIRKIKAFRAFLEGNGSFLTTFYEIGDGMSVSIKK